MDNNLRQLDNMIKECSSRIISQLGNNLEALILVGSFARGEGLAFQNNGKLTLLSDIEFLAVVKNIKKARPSTSAHHLGSKISLGFTTKRHLKRLKPYIFTVETKRFGKVLWGNSIILDLIPRYSYESIDPLDGFILLNNRIVEQLILLKRIRHGENINQYDLDKGYIQLANSILTVHKRYKSLYREKENEVNKLFFNNPILKDRINEAFLSIRNQKFDYVSQEAAIQSWEQIRGSYKEAWFYEINRLFPGASEQGDKIFKCIHGPMDKVKGWAKVFSTKEKRTLLTWKEKFLNAILTSPQCYIYGLAMNEYFNDNAMKTANSDRIINLWEKIIK